MHRNDMTRMRHLLLLLQRAHLFKPKRRKTFMEVAGIEHREVTISKILAFFLESDAEHGLGDLWLRSLLLAASDSNSAFSPTDLQISPASTMTEVVTNNIDANLRIDVVVQTPDLTIGIENKIGASLYNDLASYAGQVRDMAGDRLPLLLTLTLHDEAKATVEHAPGCQELGVALCNVTYANLFALVKEGVGEAMLAADREWLGYMRDFMRTIENLGEPEMQYDRELFEFMGENMPEVGIMREKMEEVTRATRRQGERLVTLLSEDPELSSLGIGKPRIWQPAGSCGLTCSTYYDVPLHGRGQRIHPEVGNVVSCMDLKCWVSNSAAKAVARARLEECGYTILKESERNLVVKELPLSTSDEQMVEELRQLVKDILPIIKR